LPTSSLSLRDDPTPGYEQYRALHHDKCMYRSKLLENESCRLDSVPIRKRVRFLKSSIPISKYTCTQTDKNWQAWLYLPELSHCLALPPVKSSLLQSKLITHMWRVLILTPSFTASLLLCILGFILLVV